MLFRLFNKLILLTFIVLPVLAVHNGVITDVRRVSDQSIEKTEKTLINSTQRAQKVWNALPYVGIGALLTGAGYLAYRHVYPLEKPVGPNLPQEAQKDLLKFYEDTRDKESKAKSAKAFDDDKKKAEDDKKNQTWTGWAKEGAMGIGSSIGTSATGFFKQLPANLVWLWLGGFVYKRAAKITDRLETYAPAVVDRATDLFSTKPDYDWFISSRTKFKESVSELNRFVKMYLNKFSIDDQILSIEVKVAAAKKMFENASADADIDPQDFLGLQEMFNNLDELKAEKKAIALYSEYDLCQRISLNSSYFIMQIEKILGFMNYSSKVALVSKINKKKKKEIIDKNELIRNALKTLTNELAQSIEVEVKQGKNDNTSQFAQEFESFIKKIKQEIVSFYDVESDLAESLS